MRHSRFLNVSAFTSVVTLSAGLGLMAQPAYASGATNAGSNTVVRQIATPTLAAVSPLTVSQDSKAVGTVFGSITRKKVLSSKVVHSSALCESGWQVSTTNNTAFILDTPTNGNVTGTRVDFGQTGATYLMPGQTATYCVAFSRSNQVFDVLYNVVDPKARVGDVALLVTQALGFPTSDAVALTNLISSVGTLPAMQRIGACFGRSPLCSILAINALMKDPQSKRDLVIALVSY